MTLNLRMFLEEHAEWRSMGLAFTAAFGREQDGTWQFPGSLRLFGGGPDCRAVYLPVTWGGMVAAAHTSEAEVRVCSLNYPGEEFRSPLGTLAPARAPAPAWAEPALRGVGAFAPMGRQGGWPGGLGSLGGLALLAYEVMPPSWGVESAVAVSCAAAEAIRTLYGAELAPERQADLGELGAQLTSTWCPSRRAVVVDGRQGTGEVLDCDLAANGLRLLLIHLRDPEAPQAASLPPDGEAAADALRNGDWQGLGALLTGRDGLSPAARGARDAVLGAGALGAGLSYVAPGESATLVALAPAGTLRAIRSALAAASGFLAPPRVLSIGQEPLGA